jgi:hypothetical protein
LLHATIIYAYIYKKIKPSMKRRSLIKSMGALSLGIAAPSLPEGEALADPYETKQNCIFADILVAQKRTSGENTFVPYGYVYAPAAIIPQHTPGN